VNNNEVATIPQGVLSEPIPITFSFPCALELTLIPTASSDLVVFEPYSIQVPIGTVETSF
jgi:hypothetical protein